MVENLTNFIAIDFEGFDAEKVMNKAGVHLTSIGKFKLPPSGNYRFSKSRYVKISDPNVK